MQAHIYIYIYNEHKSMTSKKKKKKNNEQYILNKPKNTIIFTHSPNKFYNIFFSYG